MSSVDTLLKTDKATLALEATKDGKVRVSTSAWTDPKVILKNEVLEVRWYEGQPRIAPKDREHDAADPPIPVYDPYCEGDTHVASE